MGGQPGRQRSGRGSGVERSPAGALASPVTGRYPMQP